MFPGQIPTPEELTSLFPANFCNLAFNNFYIHRNTRLFSMYEYTSAINYPTSYKIFSWSLPIYHIDYVNHNNFCVETNFPKIKQLHIVDDLFHWRTDYLHIKTHIFTNAEILARLKVPLLSWSYATQIAVNHWAKNKPQKEIYSVLKQAATKWQFNRNTRWYKPTKKWNNITPIVVSFTVYTDLLITYFTSQTTSASLLQYSERATNYFPFKIGKTPAYKIPMGIELELENLSSENLKILKTTLNTHCIFKRDGSLTNGVEICSAPATLDIHKQEFKNFFSSSHTLTATNNCGLHIHISKDKLSHVQLAKILVFMNNSANTTHINKLAGRQPNSYCRLVNYSWFDVVNLPNGSKYERINILPEKTIEFRLFASTTDYTLFLSRVEFVQAVIDYCQSGEHLCSIKNIASWDNFKTYVHSKKHFYPTLIKAF